MAGVKGRSGGARPGAGRPKKEQPALSVPSGEDPLKFLLGVMNDVGQDPRLRVRAAVAAVQYTHPKMGEGGKKRAADKAAEGALTGRFAPPAPPPRAN